MLYYKVKPEHDNAPKFVYVGSYYYMKQDGVLVGNELYTPRERQKIANSDRFFEEVEVSKREVHWFFGARFQNSEVAV